MSDQTTHQEFDIPTEPALAELLPSELAADPSIKDIPNVATLAKNYLETKKFVGNSIRIPSSEASAEDKKSFLSKLSGIDDILIKPSTDDAEAMAAFNTKLGIPSSPEGYTYEFEEGTQLPVGTEFIEDFNKFAYEHRLTKSQADALLKTEIARMSENVKVREEAAKATTAKLQETWGQAYDDKMNLVNSVLDRLNKKMPEDVEALINSGALTNPTLLMLLADAGEQFAEKSAAGVKIKSSNKTPDEAGQEIKDIRTNLNHPFHIPSHPQHQAALDHMSKLYDAMYASKSGQ